MKNANAHMGNVQELIHKVEQVSSKMNVNFMISMCCDPKDLPESVQKFLVQ